MTSSQQTTALLPNWNELFKQRSKNSLDDKPTLQAKHMLGSEWAEPQPAQQSERVKSVLVVNKVEEQELEAAKGASQKERMEGAELQREDPQNDLNTEAVAIAHPPKCLPSRLLHTIMPSSLPKMPTPAQTDPLGWNVEHPHNTHFHHQANIDALHKTLEDDNSPLDRVTAFICQACSNQHK